MPVPVDRSRIPVSVGLFDSVTGVSLTKIEMFKHAVLKHEVPADHLYPSDFQYLQSKVAAYHTYFDDFVEVSPHQVLNKATDDRLKGEVSEVVGIAFGIQVATEAFGVRPEVIRKVPRPKGKRRKYMDYVFPSGGGVVELETKGTTSPSVSKAVADILKKKSGTPVFRFGTVTVLGVTGGKHQSVVHLCDDPPKTVLGSPDGDSSQHYLSALARTMDTRAFNAIVREDAAEIGKVARPFFGRYLLDGVEFVGDFFDHRLGHDALAKVPRASPDEAYQELTRRCGRIKIFLGVRRDIFEAFVQEGSVAGRALKHSHRRLELRDEEEHFLGSDGILVVVARNGKNEQVERQFDEAEVRRRLGLGLDHQYGEAPTCGEPCRSREKEGKPCEIRTYRRTCHFHG